MQAEVCSLSWEKWRKRKCRAFVTLWYQRDVLQDRRMYIDYSVYRNRDGLFYRPSIDVMFTYTSKQFPYAAALVDTGSDFVMLPMAIAEILGIEPDLESATEMNCACGDTFKSFISRYPIEIAVDHQGLSTKPWKTFVQLVDANVPVLLGHRGFLDRFDVTFSSKRRRMEFRHRSR